MVNKKGFWRVLEALLGVIVIVGFLIFLIGSRNEESFNFENEGERILRDIAENESLRGLVLEDTSQSVQELESFVVEKISNPSLNSSLNVCEINEICENEVSVGEEVEVFSIEKIISSNLKSAEFAPKKIKIYIWKN